MWEYLRGFFGFNVNLFDGVEFCGGKGNLYEGGLCILFFVCWLERVVVNCVSDFVFY